MTKSPIIKHRLIVIEGGDGSGKATQTKLLAEYLESIGYDVLSFSFPQYGKSSALFVERYLNNKYGNAVDVPADLASLPFAIDRLAATEDISRHLNKDNSIVLLDRYTGSNMAHQGTKFDNDSDRHSYYREIMDIEYGILGVIEPDINIVLLLPAETAQANIDKKSARTYTDKRRDGHEADANHLDKTRRNYKELSDLYPDKFTPIDCMLGDGSGQRSIDDIQQEIRQLITTQ